MQTPVAHRQRLLTQLVHDRPDDARAGENDQGDRPAVAAGQGAVFILAKSATVDRVVDALKPYSPSILQTDLTKDREEEEELARALQT
jgi:hypothetical protein